MFPLGLNCSRQGSTCTSEYTVYYIKYYTTNTIPLGRPGVQLYSVILSEIKKGGVGGGGANIQTLS